MHDTVKLGYFRNTTLDPNKKCALLRYSKANAEADAKALSDGDMEFTYIPQTPISEITTDTAWLTYPMGEYYLCDFSYARPMPPYTRFFAK